uniref:Uncharacterized protein n=1 Tax=Meloidogyne enterolobii TaxID=390850 RepID=A0A6V7XJ44_MELEN|nr:unnamed protein product [Meloidogyne enterolobii]
MESTPQQNFNQYLLPHQLSSVYTPSMNMQINSQNYCQPYFFPHFFGYPNNILPQQAMYAPSFMASESIQPSEQNCYFVPENMSQADIEKLLLETIPDLNGTENNFEIKKFFKKFDAHLEDWPEKKKIFALKSKLFGKAKSCFILAIKSKHCNYKSIKHFILCQLIPSEYKVEELINSIKKKTTSKLEHLEKNFEKKENLIPKIQKPAQYKINIPFENVSYPSEVLEFFESPEETEPSKVKNEFKLVKEMKISPPTNLEIKKIIKPEVKKKSFVLDLEETDFEFPLNLFEDEKELKLVESLKNSVPTDLPKKKIKKTIKETNLVEKFEKEDDFELPMNLFEEKEEVKFKKSEKVQVETKISEDISFENMVKMFEEDEPVDEDFDELRKEKANELGRMKNELELWNQENSLEIEKKNFENFEKVLDPIIEENFKEKRREKANELGRMKIGYEFIDQNVMEFESKGFENFGKESVPPKEFIGKENFMESEGLIASSNFEFMRFLKFSKTRKSFIVNAKKIWKKSIKKMEILRKILS